MLTSYDRIEKAEREVRELAKQVLNLKWNAYDGSDPTSPLLVEREDFEELRKRAQKLLDYYS